ASPTTTCRDRRGTLPPASPSRTTGTTTRSPETPRSQARTGARERLGRRHRPRLVRLPLAPAGSRRGQFLAAQPLGRPVRRPAPRRAVALQAEEPRERDRGRRLLRVLRGS